MVYLTCYQVLRAWGDGRAGEVLTPAQAALLERAAHIGDEPPLAPPPQPCYTHGAEGRTSPIHRFCHRESRDTSGL
jgi:hypothetical protein